MNIKYRSVVRLHYTLKDGAGNLLESTNAESEPPVSYLHGYNNLVPGLENALLGRAAGEKLSVTLQPEEAYGLYRDDAVQRLPLKHLQGATKWKAGMMAMVETRQGLRQVQIKKVGKFMADIDLNHPLAGKVLTFDVQIVDVRDATPEEVQHGHAHDEHTHAHD